MRSTLGGFATRMALLFVLGAATVGAAGPPSPEVARLLDRMRAASGPVWSTHFVSISRLAVDGQTSVIESDGQGVAFSLRRCAGELCDGTYFDGNRLFAVNMNGTAVPQSDRGEPYLRSLRIIASLGFLSPSFTAQGGRLDDAGWAQLAGKRFRSFFVVDPEAIPVRIYVDPQTALIRYARDINGDDTFEYRDYRRVNGFTLPFEILHNGDVLERYDDRTAVATAFAPPRGLVPRFDGPPEPVATEANRVTPIFTCTVAGLPLKCLLDTGNSGLSMSSELAARLDAPVAGTFRVRGLGNYATQVVRAGPLRVGNATFPEAYYVVLSDISQYGYDVVLGADALGATHLDLDAAAHTVVFGAPAATRAITVPLSFENFVPVVDVQLDGVPAKLAIDTGDESNINLGHDFYSKHPTLFTATQQRLVAGIGGRSVELIGQIPQMTIGDYRTGPQQIGTTQTLAGTAFGHLGAEFLRQFQVQLDYAAGELHLTPRP